jgi:ubiquitin-like modifier-activating enzyme ATG7
LHLNLSEASVEIDEHGRPTPTDVDHYSQQRTIDLKVFMDEKLLAGEAVDLNIKLMKWRMLPNIDLEVMKNTRVLLFGSGTLGC